MTINKDTVTYDQNFKAKKSGSTLIINDTNKVATTEVYHAAGNLKVDTNYIFDGGTRYNPMYCTGTYSGCTSCVDQCNYCVSGCHASCQGCTSCAESCHGGCNSSCNGACNGCTTACQSCDSCVDSCVSCANNCNSYYCGMYGT